MVSNTGNADLSVTVSSSDGQFTLSPSFLTVGAGGSQEVTVTFTPSGEGSKSGTLTIASNDPDEGSVTVLSFGIALPEVVTPVAAPSISVSTDMLRFGDVWVGERTHRSSSASAQTISIGAGIT